jgi:hypothetical protein
MCIKDEFLFTVYPGLFPLLDRFLLIDPHLHGQYIRPPVGHDVHIRHNMDGILQVPLCEIGQVLVPVSEDQDHELLDEQADEGDEAVHPEDDADEDPVKDTDEKFEAARRPFEHEELMELR